MAYRIALADDSETIRKVVQLVLEPEGFTIAAYRNGEEALEAIALDPPDLVFADIDLPKMSGVLLCTSIKDDASTSHIPVILLAGAFEAFDEESARLSGADDIIVKPFESRELVSKVKALVAKSASVKSNLSPVTDRDESVASESSAPVAVADDAVLEASAQAAEETVGAASADDELAREWAASMEPETEVSTPAAVEELSEDERLAREWAASMEPETAASAPAAVEELSEDERLAREWAASMAEEESASAPVDVPKPTVPFSAVLQDEIAQQSADIVTDSSQIIPSVAVAAAPMPAAVLGEHDREEIRSMVRSAVDEALAELLQSERSRIQGEIETAVRSAVREVAEAILKRELNRTVSQD